MKLPKCLNIDIKTVIAILIFLCNNILTQSQSKDILAKSAMLNAESSYENGNYRECLDFLKEVEQNLGKTNSRIQYVKVKSLIALGSQNGYNKDFLLRADQELKVFFNVTPENSYVPEKYDEMVLELTRLKRMIAESDKEIEMENQYFIAAKKSNTIDAYRQYIDRYPKGRSVSEAEERIKELVRQKDLLAKIQECTNTINNIPNKKWTKWDDIIERDNAYFKRGNAKFELEDYQGAIQDYNMNIEHNPNNTSAYLNRALAKSKLNDYKASIQDYDIAIKLDPKSSEGFLYRGILKLKLENYQDAIQDFTKRIELIPTDAYSFFLRGISEYNLKNYKGAISDFTKSIELDPTNTDAFIYRGYAKNFLMDYQGEIQDLTKIIELTPTNPDAYFNSGKAKFFQKDYKGVIKDLTKVIELTPANSDAYFNRGKAKFLLKDYPGAIEDFTKTIELQPDNLYAYYCRGKILQLYLKRNLAAKPDFEKIIMLNTDSTLTAFSLFFLGNKEKAFSQLNKIVKDAGNNTEKLKNAHLNLACLYSIAGNKTEAIAELNKSLMNGYDNFSWIEEDTDFDNIKNGLEFKQLINKYKYKSNGETISDRNQPSNDNNTQQPQNSVTNSNNPVSNNNPVKAADSEANKSDKNIQITSATSNSGINFPSALNYGSVSDVEGNTYKTVQIGTQTWMAENLKATRLNDGLEIPNVTESAKWDTLSTPAFCWYNNDTLNKTEYGALYNFYTINSGKLCPADWHLPSDAEWAILINSLGGETKAGESLKESGTVHWKSPNTGATNKSGFTGLPGGVRRNDGGYFFIGEMGCWYSSTIGSSKNGAFYYVLLYNSGFAPRLDNNVINGFSVRCVKE